MIRTEDGVTVKPGDIVFNYYDRRRGVIVGPPDSSGWFDVDQDDGSRAYLNGERICSLRYATARGWL